MVFTDRSEGHDTPTECHATTIISWKVILYISNCGSNVAWCLAHGTRCYEVVTFTFGTYVYKLLYGPFRSEFHIAVERTLSCEKLHCSYSKNSLWGKLSNRYKVILNS